MDIVNKSIQDNKINIPMQISTIDKKPMEKFIIKNDYDNFINILKKFQIKM